MKIIAISDSHGKNIHDKINECDLLLIGGDISPFNMDHSFYTQQRWFMDNFIPELEAISKVAKKIVFIGGNHDTYLSEVSISDKNSDRINGLLPDNVHYLCDEAIEIEGVKIWGSPWCNRPFWANTNSNVWNFSKIDDELSSVYNKIPNDIDILLTHGPAFGFCDVILDKETIDRNAARFGTPSNNRCGSKSLINRIIRDLRPKYVLSGHIHSANHNYEYYKYHIDKESVKFACVSILNEYYEFESETKPLVINYDKST